jgi:hypothetical protein
VTPCAEAASENTAALAHMRRSPSTFFDRAETAASHRPESYINVPDVFANTTLLPQRVILSYQVMMFMRNYELQNACPGANV